MMVHSLILRRRRLRITAPSTPLRIILINTLRRQYRQLSLRPVQRKQPVLRIEFLRLRIFVDLSGCDRVLRFAAPDLLVDVVVLFVVVFEFSGLVIAHLHEEAVDDVSVVLVVADLLENQVHYWLCSQLILSDLMKLSNSKATITGQLLTSILILSFQESVCNQKHKCFLNASLRIMGRIMCNSTDFIFDKVQQNL